MSLGTWMKIYMYNGYDKFQNPFCALNCEIMVIACVDNVYVNK